MESVENTFEVPITSNATTIEGSYKFFGNQAARKSYLVFTMSSKPAGKVLSIT